MPKIAHPTWNLVKLQKIGISDARRTNILRYGKHTFRHDQTFSNWHTCLEPKQKRPSKITNFYKGSTLSTWGRPCIKTAQLGLLSKILPWGYRFLIFVCYWPSPRLKYLFYSSNRCSEGQNVGPELAVRLAYAFQRILCQEHAPVVAETISGLLGGCRFCRDWKMDRGPSKQSEMSDLVLGSFQQGASRGEKWTEDRHGDNNHIWCQRRFLWQLALSIACCPRLVLSHCPLFFRAQVPSNHDWRI